MSALARPGATGRLRADGLLRRYGDVAAFAAEHGLDFYSAFTGVTGRLDVERAAQLEQPPLRQTDFSDQASLAAFYKHAE